MPPVTVAQSLASAQGSVASMLMDPRVIFGTCISSTLGATHWPKVPPVIPGRSDVVLWPMHTRSAVAPQRRNGIMTNPPDGLPSYRVLTGPDDEAFCRRVSEAIGLGFELHGGPSLTYNGDRVIVAQALTWPGAPPSGEPMQPVRSRQSTPSFGLLGQTMTK